MLFPIVKAVALSGFFCPLIASLLAPHLEVLDSQKRADGAYPARAACVNTPLTRGCWDLGLSIDVDMDVNFPNTGKVVKVDMRHNSALRLLIFKVQFDNHERNESSRWVRQTGHARQRPISRSGM
jgi:hypothetical protein